MNKSISLLAIFAIIFISLPSCRDHVMRGEGAKTTKTISLETFNAIDISISSVTTVNVVPGSQAKIEIVGYENHISHIFTKIEGSTLSIYDDLKPRWTFGNKKVLEFRITTPSLEELALSGATDAYMHGNLSGKAFKLDVSGAVNVVVDSVNVTDLSADMSGAASIEINGGNAQTAAYDISGAAKVKAFGLKTNESTTSISGAAKAEVTASEKLLVDISGAGKVYYKGHPVITKDISGAGSVSDAN